MLGGQFVQATIANNNNVLNQMFTSVDSQLGAHRVPIGFGEKLFEEAKSRPSDSLLDIYKDTLEKV